MNHQPRKRISLKTLSDERRNLILVMHKKQFGTIRDLRVVAGEPILANAKVVRRHNLAKETVTKSVSNNFVLKDIHLRLLKMLDQIGDGKLERLTFRDGLPCELDECET